MSLKDWLLEASEEEGMLKQEQDDHEEQARLKLARRLEAQYEEECDFREWKQRRQAKGKA